MTEINEDGYKAPVITTWNQLARTAVWTSAEKQRAIPRSWISNHRRVNPSKFDAIPLRK